MLGLPLWAVQLILSALKAVGATPWAENLALKTAVSVEVHLAKLKTYTTTQPGDVTPPYPEGKNSGL